MHILFVFLCVQVVITLSSAIQCHSGTEVGIHGDHSQDTAKSQVSCSADYCMWVMSSKFPVEIIERGCPTQVHEKCEVNECKYGTLSIPNRTTGKTLYVKTTTCCCNGDLCNDLMPDVKPRRLTREEDEKLEEELKKKIQEAKWSATLLTEYHKRPTKIPTPRPLKEIPTKKGQGNGAASTLSILVVIGVIIVARA